MLPTSPISTIPNLKRYHGDNPVLKRIIKTIVIAFEIKSTSFDQTGIENSTVPFFSETQYAFRMIDMSKYCVCQCVRGDPNHD